MTDAPITDVDLKQLERLAKAAGSQRVSIEQPAILSLIARLRYAEGPLLCDVCGEQLQRESCNRVRACHTCETGAVAAEREACAKMLEDALAAIVARKGSTLHTLLTRLIDTIRARGGG